jgi:hypothetical protein
VSLRQPFRVAALVALLPWGGAGIAGDDARPLARLFPSEADVSAERPGLVRLRLPAEVLEACRPDLSDLRLFDGAGSEIAYLVEGGAGSAGAFEQREVAEAAVLDVRREEIDRGSGLLPKRREAYVLAMPASQPRSGSWTLVVRAAAHELVAAFEVEGLGAAGESAAFVDRDSLFRLPSSGAERMRLVLPAFSGRRLRVALESEHATWLDPAFRFESATELERGGTIDVPLALLSARSEGGRTAVEIERPRGIVPSLLRIATSTSAFDRHVEVRDVGPAARAEPLGAGRIFRVAGLAPVGVDELPLAPAAGHSIRVVIEDGDSPPLAELAFEAVVRQPALVFALEPGDGAEPRAILRFGGGRAHRPRYDLSALAPRAGERLEGDRARAASLLHDPATVAPARLGPIRTNPAFDGSPVLAFAMRPGSEIDRRTFRYRRELVVPEAREGLSMLTLAPADLAVAGEDLTDVRVTDDDSRQWPYLLEPRAVDALVPLAIRGPERHGGESHYILRGEVAPLAASELRLVIDGDFFDREFRLEADVGGESRTLASGRLSRPIGDETPVLVPLPGARADELRLEVRDGDDAPLPLRSAQARVVLPVLYLTAPQGRYDLLLGAPASERPRYELERVREVVLAVEAAPIAAAALTENPRFSRVARLGQPGSARVWALWTVLLGAAAALVVLTLRMARARP